MSKLIESIELEFLITANIIILVSSVIMYAYIMWRYTSEQRMERKERDRKNWNEGYRCGLKDGAFKATLTKEHIKPNFPNDR